jgi:hypothetical protein
MATVVKNFKVKNGLIVEGATATVNNFDILTKSAGDTTYIQGLVGGVANSSSVANAIVLRDANKNFAANVITADLIGDVTGTVSDISNFDTNDLAEGTTNLYFSNARAQAATAASYDAAGTAATAAGTAYTNAITYAGQYTDNAIASLVDSAPALLDTLNELAAAIGDDANFATTLTNSVALKQNTLTAGSNISITGNTIAVTGLDTDDVSEGANLYFSNARAKTSAAELLTGATLTNITISGTGAGLTISAENGVADSDTDDLVEGTSNLYFSNARAVSALQAVTPNFTEVAVNSLAKNIAATASISTASAANVIYSWPKSAYRSGEFLVKIANGSHTEVSKLILTLDTADNVAITEYAIVGTNGALGTVTADVSGSNVRVLVTTANNTSVISVVGTVLV